MSKYRKAFKAEFGYEFHHAPAIVRQAWQAAWNARGRVDAEICKNVDYRKNSDVSITCREAIEKEQK